MRKAYKQQRRWLCHRPKFNLESFKTKPNQLFSRIQLSKNWENAVTSEIHTYFIKGVLHIRCTPAQPYTNSSLRTYE